MRTLREHSVAFIIAILSCIVHFRQAIGSGFSKLYGDLGDARLVGTLHEHWCEVLSGQVHWLDARIFYPLQKTLGYSDAFFASGVLQCIVSPFTNNNFVLATQITIFLLHAIGGYIFFLYLHRFWKLSLLSSSFGCALLLLNSPLANKLGHLQMQIFVFLPPLLWGLSWLLRESGNIAIRQWHFFSIGAFSAVMLGMQLLTAFYPAWFFIFFCAVAALVMLTLQKGRETATTLFKRRKGPILGSLLVFGAFVAPFLMIYLPVVNTLGGRTVADGLYGLPGFKQYFFVGLDNIVWGTLMRTGFSFFETAIIHEKTIGIGLLPSLIYFGSTLAFFYQAFRQLSLYLRHKNAKIAFPRFSSNNSCPWYHVPHQRLRFAVFVIFPTCALIQLLMTYHGSTTSPWILIHKYFPGASAIRAGGRFMVILMIPLSLGLAIVLESALRHFLQNPPKKFSVSVGPVAVCAIAVFSLFEQLNSGYLFDARTDWERMERASRNLKIVADFQDQIGQPCEAFYITPGKTRLSLNDQYIFQVDAMILTRLNDLPTLNGYTGIFPPKWELWNVNSPEYQENVQSWLELNSHSSAQACSTEALGAVEGN